MLYTSEPWDQRPTLDPSLVGPEAFLPTHLLPCRSEMFIDDSPFSKICALGIQIIMLFSMCYHIIVVHIENLAQQISVIQTHPNDGSHRICTTWNLLDRQCAPEVFPFFFSL